jgi:hypothetical protein
MRQPIFSDNSLRLAVTCRSVVNDGIEAAEFIDLLGDTSRLGNAGQVPDDYRFCCGKFVLSLVRPL